MKKRKSPIRHRVTVDTIRYYGDPKNFSYLTDRLRRPDDISFPEKDGKRGIELWWR